MEKIKVTIDWLNNYGAVSDRVPGCVATHQTFEGIKEGYASALEFHLEGLDSDELPEWIEGGYTLEFELTTRALLHRLDGIVTRSALSRVTGINERQLGHYFSGLRNPRPEQRDKIINGIHSIGESLMSVV